MESLMQGLAILAHILIGFYFAFLGCWNIYHWTPLMEVMAKRDIPHPYFILPVGIMVQVITGTMIMFGILVKLASLFLIPSTILAVCPCSNSLTNSQASYGQSYHNHYTYQ